MKLLAISDLHVGYERNWRALENLSARPDDWLILGGDIAESVEQLEAVLTLLQPKFQRLIWIPGNHELWTMGEKDPLRGVAKYEALVAVCRRFGVATPEDPYPIFESGGRRFGIVPMFLLYDYTFRPDDVSAENALAWARERGIVCADEHVLHPDPFPSRIAWCESRVAETHRRISELPEDLRLVLVNHFPLRYDLARLPLIPRFSLWCGTKQTENWHREFNVEAVVYGPLHIPQTQFRDGVRFEEVSLGYPKQWPVDLGIDSRVREILNGEAA